MDNNQPKYTRTEKIAYYAKRIAHLEMAISRNKSQLDYAKQRLAHITSDEYQDWNSDLAEELKTKAR